MVGTIELDTGIEYRHLSLYYEKLSTQSAR